MENNNEGNLPVQSKQKGLMNNPRFVDGLNRGGKIAKGLGIVLAGGVLTIGSAVLGAVGAPVIAASALSLAGLGAMIGGGVAGGYNILYRNDKDLMFHIQRKFDNKLHIYQRTDSYSKAKGLSPADILGIMTLNTIVGLARYQALCQEKHSQMLPNGRRVYDQVFSTRTHSVNLRNFETLADLGYIQITDRKDAGTSSLAYEKMSVGNTKGISKKRTKMERMDFKLTDKKIDLREMYMNYISKDPKERRQDKIGALLFNERRGILRDDNPRGIGISYDRFGRPVIEYDSKGKGLSSFEKDPIVVDKLDQDRKDFIARIEVDEKEKQEQKEILATFAKQQEMNKNSIPMVKAIDLDEKDIDD